MFGVCVYMCVYFCVCVFICLCLAFNWFNDGIYISTCTRLYAELFIVIKNIERGLPPELERFICYFDLFRIDYSLRFMGELGLSIQADTRPNESGPQWHSNALVKVG